MPKPKQQRFNKHRNNKKHNFKPRFKPKSEASNNEYKHKNQLQEVDVGITQFISKLEGFSGIIKARFSDFHVNEINLDGEVAKLTNQEIPKDFNVENDRDKVIEVPQESPLPQIPEETWASIKQLLESDNKTNTEIELEATETSKVDRTQVHECLKKFFGRKIICNTVTKDGSKKMIFKKFDGKNDEKRLNWPKGKGEYVHFLVYKESIDTLDVTLRIASCVKMSPSNFAYAGVKDKRAKTTQWFSAKKLEPWKLIIKTKSIKNVRVGNITFKDKPLKLGDLNGNKFRIALRNVNGSDNLIEESIQNLKEKGFINYFGLQRFGNDKEVPTYSVGVQLLLGNWKQACEIILKPIESDLPDLDLSKAKKIYAETRDAAKALTQFGDDRNTSIEYLLLSGLSKGHENDFVNALAKIPRNTRLLYIHSFQSLVWNLVASKRIEKFGLEVVEGDLVVAEESNEIVNEDSVADPLEPKGIKVRTLSSDECSKHTIYDIVLPLPGYDVIYPEHLKEFYKEILEQYGLTLEMAKQKVKDYNLSGTYRKLMGQVQDISWKIMYYSDPNHNLIRSDWEELKGFEEPKSVEGGPYKALVLEFSLHSSCYATMALRELLKTDTSSSSHAKLNNYHETTQEKKKIQVEETTVNEDLEDNTDKIGLLNDTQKYEAFKNFVFNEEAPTLKRKHEEDANEDTKIAKIEEGS